MDTISKKDKKSAVIRRVVIAALLLAIPCFIGFKAVNRHILLKQWECQEAIMKSSADDYLREKYGIKAKFIEYEYTKTKKAPKSMGSAAG